MKGLELIDSAGPLRAARIDGVAHLDLRIDAAVEAVMSDRLRNEQQRDGEQAQAADGSQHWVGMGSHHFPGGEGLVVVVSHDLAPCLVILNCSRWSLAWPVSRGADPSPGPHVT